MVSVDVKHHVYLRPSLGGDTHCASRLCSLWFRCHRHRPSWGLCVCVYARARERDKENYIYIRLTKSKKNNKLA